MQYEVILPDIYDEELDYKFYFENYKEAMNFAKIIIDNGYGVKIDKTNTEE